MTVTKDGFRQYRRKPSHLSEVLNANLPSFCRLFNFEPLQIKEQNAEQLNPTEKLAYASHVSSEDDPGSSSDTIRAQSSYFPSNNSEEEKRLYVLICIFLPTYRWVTSLYKCSIVVCHRCRILKV